MVERLVANEKIAGSIPVSRSTKTQTRLFLAGLCVPLPLLFPIGAVEIPRADLR